MHTDRRTHGFTDDVLAQAARRLERPGR